MTDTAEPLSLAKTMVGAFVGVVLTVLIGVAQLVWLDRADRVDDLLASFVGPFLGALLGAWLGRRRRRDKRPRHHSLVWHAGLGLLVMCSWLVVVAAVTGGLGTDVVVPTVVLGLVGTAAFVTVTKVITPELVR